MKKVYILWSIVSAMIMLMLPWLAVTFVKGDAGMAACLILFFWRGSDILHYHRSFCGKRPSVFIEPSGHFGCAIPHRYMDIF